MNKKPPVVSRKLRASAHGQDCTMQVVGVCNSNPETVVLAHINTTGTGSKGAKCHDFSAAFMCSACHSWYDGHAGSEIDRLFYSRRAMVRTWELWVAMGLITING